VRDLNLYYVTSPSLGINALVESPDTYQARTLFLDYLERQDTISRDQRSLYRRQILTKKVDASTGISTDIYIEYVPGKLGGVEELTLGASAEEPPLSSESPSPSPSMSPLAKVALTGKM